MSESCGECRYYRGDLDLIDEQIFDEESGFIRFVVGPRHPCLRYPKHERKVPDEWCGEFKRRDA